MSATPPGDGALEPLGAQPESLEELDRLVATLYDELRRVARGQRRRLGERGRHGPNTTAIVHDAYLRLAGSPQSYNDSEHFLASAARAMRHLLVDQARQRLAAKRGGGQLEVTLTEAGHPAAALLDQAARLLDLDKALVDLGTEDPRLAQVIECQFFAGLSRSETARALGLSERTLRRDSAKARAWLELRLGQPVSDEEP